MTGALDTAVQTFLWELRPASARGDEAALTLLTLIDDGAAENGCWPCELWVMRAVVVTGAATFDGGQRPVWRSSLRRALPELRDAIDNYVDRLVLAALVADEPRGRGLTLTVLGEALLARDQHGPLQTSLLDARVHDAARRGVFGGRPSPATRATAAAARELRGPAAHLEGLKLLHPERSTRNLQLDARLAAANLKPGELAARIHSSLKTIGRSLSDTHLNRSLRDAVLIARELGCGVEDILSDRLRREPCPSERTMWGLPPSKLAGP